MGRQSSLVSFIAIPIPTDIQYQISKLQNQLKRYNFPFIWEKPEKLHITISFLGKVKPQALHQLYVSLSPQLEIVSPFKIQANYMDYLYKKHGDSILFLGIGEDKEVKNLEKIIKRILTDHNFSPPLRFMPHITIGRLKRTGHPNQTKQILFSAKNQLLLHIDSFIVDKLAIMEAIQNEFGNSSHYYSKYTLQLGNIPVSI